MPTKSNKRSQAYIKKNWITKTNFIREKYRDTVKEQGALLKEPVKIHQVRKAFKSPHIRYI